MYRRYGEIYAKRELAKIMRNVIMNADEVDNED